ncbi:MAG: ABC transporter ATP-binding protein/permease [Acidobacteriota bacterium]|nr:ABC transporter ATP-binding protein/permease [Acidobacteriota bacterium]
MRTLPFLWRYGRRYTGWILLALVSVATYALATGGVVALVEPLFGEVLMTDERPGAAALVDVEPPAPAAPASAARQPATWLDELKEKLNLRAALQGGYASLKRRLGINADNVVYLVPLLMVVVLLVRSLASFLSGYSFQHIGLGMTTDMRNDLFRRIVDQSSHFHEAHTSGELVSRVVTDVTVMQNASTSRLLDLFQQTPTLLVLLVVLLNINFELALVCLVVAPVFVYPIARFGKGMWRTSHRSQERMADLTQLLSEATRGHRVVKAFGMEDFEHTRFAAATGRHLRVKLRAQILTHVSGPVVEALAAIGAAVFLVYAGKAVRSGQLTASVLVQFMTALMMLYEPVRKLNKVNLILQEARAAAQRVAGILAVPNRVRDRAGATEAGGFRESIRFEGVTFGYGAEAVLREVELEIRRGEVVAVVGPSGAGKSTLINLLPRFYDPDAGRITIDGVDIRDLTLESLRGLIGIVTQETVLFDETVRNNIAYGRSDLPLAAVREAAAAAYADEFILDLPAGYDTRIGESGMRLSGGQRQRLAIARALLKNAPILILDEATSHLDSESEALVQKALYNLMRARTSLVIAHRLSTVKSADRIIVMEAGRITQIGTHAELLAEGGTYKRLHDLQFRA